MESILNVEISMTGRIIEEADANCMVFIGNFYRCSMKVKKMSNNPLHQENQTKDEFLT